MRLKRERILEPHRRLEEYYEDYPTDNGFARTGQTCVYYGSSKYNGPDCTGLVLSGSNSFDLYSSTQENSVQNLLMRLGYSKKTPFGTAYQSPNTAADALLSVTNVIAEEQPPETELVGDHAQKLYGSYRDWKTTSSMPLGYGIAATAEETELANKADYSNAATDATDDCSHRRMERQPLQQPDSDVRVRHRRRRKRSLP